MTFFASCFPTALDQFSARKLAQPHLFNCFPNRKHFLIGLMQGYACSRRPLPRNLFLRLYPHTKRLYTSSFCLSNHGDYAQEHDLDCFHSFLNDQNARPPKCDVHRNLLLWWVRDRSPWLGPLLLLTFLFPTALGSLFPKRKLLLFSILQLRDMFPKLQYISAQARVFSLVASRPVSVSDYLKTVCRDARRCCRPMCKHYHRRE